MTPDPLDVLRGRDPEVTPDPAFVARLRARLAAEVGAPIDVTAKEQDHRPHQAQPDQKVITVDVAVKRRVDRRRVGLLGVAAAAVAALIAVLAVSTRDDADTIDVVDTPTTVSSTDPSDATSAPSTTTTPVSTTTTPVATSSTVSVDTALGLPPIRSAAESAVTSVATAAKPAQVVTAGSSVWVVPNLGPIQRFDAATGRLLGTVPLQLDRFPTRPAVAFGSVWMATEWNDQLHRIDVDSGEIVATIAIPGGLRGLGGSIPDGPAAAEDGIWVLSDASGLERTLLRIDPATNAVAQTLPAPEGADAIGYGFGSLWVTYLLQGEPGIYRVDPRTGEMLADIEISGGAIMIRIAFGSVWTSGVEANTAGGTGVAFSGGGIETLNRIDPTTNTVVAKIPYAAVAPDWQSNIVEAGEYLWISSKTALLVKIDPAQNRIVDRLLPSTGGGGVATDGTSVWFTAWDDAQLHRLPLG